MLLDRKHMIRLIFDSIHNGSALGQLGGSVPLPETISWPTDIDGKPMLHLLTLHIDALTQISPINLPNDNVVSIFIPYDHLYKGHVPLLRPTRLSKGAKVLAFKPGRNFINRNEHPLDPPLNINFEKTSKNDDNENLESKIGDTPAWLQDEIEIEDAKYFLQISYSDLDKNFPSHAGIIWGGEGYLFLFDKVASNNNFVQFVVQFT